MYGDQDRPEGISAAAERGLTLLGLLSFVILVALGFRYDLAVRLFSIHPAISICAVFLGIAMVVLAFYGLGNTWRLLRRGRRKVPFGEIDLGWGGAMGHYTEVEDDTSGKNRG